MPGVAAPPQTPPASQVRAQGLTPGAVHPPTPQLTSTGGLEGQSLRIEELEGVNRISLGFKTSSWGKHPPLFKEHFLFALYLFVVFFFHFLKNVSSVLTSGCPCSLHGFPGVVYTPCGYGTLCVLCRGWKERGTEDFPYWSPRRRSLILPLPQKWSQRGRG